jgi:hypothetical protein
LKKHYTMRKYYSLLFLAFITAGIAKADNTFMAAPDTTVPANRLITPAKRIGMTSINEISSQVYKNLGPSSMDDAAMGGKNMASWYSKPIVKNGDTIIHETNIFFTTAAFGTAHAVARAQLIRITSPWFMTKQRLGVGSSLANIKKSFPKLKKVASYVSPKTQQTVFIYDSNVAGIAFEIDGQDECIGITVHKTGDSFYVVYNALFGGVTNL